LDMVMASLSAAAPKDRESFFAECLRRRRRERKEWLDTPIARIFVERAEWATLRPRALVAQARTGVLATLAYVSKITKELDKLQEVAAAALMEGNEQAADEKQVRIIELMSETALYPRDVKAAFETYDADGDQRLSRSELTAFLKAFSVQATAGDVASIMNMLAGEGSSALSLEAFESTFGPTDAEVTGDEAAAHALGPWMCKRCCLTNLHESTMCVYCQEQPRPDLEGILRGPGPPVGQWECGVCHFYNEDESHFCDICGAARGAVMGQEDFE